MNKWLIPGVIVAICLGASISHVINSFAITSDSAREFEVYLSYITSGWQPISGNMLSTSLFTTALPAFIQSILKLPDPEIAYRLTLAVLVSFLPAAVYVLVRKYASTWLSLVMAFIFFTTFYYQGFAEYARMQVGVTFAVILLLSITSEWKRKYIAIALCTTGIAISHYTVALIYAILFISMALAMLICLKKRVKYRAEVIYTAAILACLCFVWYFVIVPYVGQNARQAIVGMTDNVTHSGVSGFTSEFIIEKIGMLVRLLAGLVIVYLLFSRRSPVLYSIAYFGVISAGMIAMWSPTVQGYIGAFRPSYIFLPVEMMCLSYWWGNKNRMVLWPLLLTWTMLYH